MLKCNEYNTVLRTELEMYLLKRREKVEMTISVRNNIPKKRLPAIADWTVWENVTKG